MAKAEILTIGTEILLGEIVDTNSRYIARLLRDHGVDIYYLSTVGDNVERIADAVQQGLARSEIIITTGGLGPTVDDPTREAAALAVGVETEFREELWQQVKERFAQYGRIPTENNRRQAYVPKGAIAVENPVGTAPAFIVETENSAVIALPGVPREMEYLLKHEVIPYLKRRFGLQGIIKARVLKTAGAGESQIDELIGDLETLTNPTVGLAAHAGAVDVRITVKAEDETEADRLITPVEAELRARLGDWVFGADKDTLEAVALEHLAGLGWSLAVVEAGLGGRLTQKLASTADTTFAGGEVLTACPDTDSLSAACRQYREAHQVDVCLGISLSVLQDRVDMEILIISPVKEHSISRSYGGPPLNAPRWAVNICLDVLRKLKAR
ncbi:MAG: CinA family nicotinamide mononucleotide deamidase-related protein [Chloroflexota bacterium]